MSRLHHPPRPRAYLYAMLLAGSILGAALLVGLCGYHFLNEEPWIDALVDASLILGGMGPYSRLVATPAKLFAACYAILSGLVLVSSAGVLLAPWVHLLLHRLHADDTDVK